MIRSRGSYHEAAELESKNQSSTKIIALCSAASITIIALVAIQMMLTGTDTNSLEIRDITANIKREPLSLGVPVTKSEPTATEVSKVDSDEEENEWQPSTKELLVRSANYFNPVKWARVIPRFFRSVLKWSKQPRWNTVSELMGASKIRKRPDHLRPARSDHELHNTGIVYHVMGASSLMFMLPTLLAGYMAISGRGNTCACVTTALCLFLNYISIFSFGADYWYHDDKPVAEGKTPSFQKQWICNAVDRVNVPLIAVASVALAACQYLYSPHMNVAYPVITGIFVVAVGAQQWSTKKKKAFLKITSTPEYKAQGKDHPQYQEASSLIWGASFLHIVWHALAVIAPLVQVYGLMRYGVNLPCC